MSEEIVDDIGTERDGSVLWIRLRRPDAANLVHPEMNRRLLAVLRDADADHDVRAIIVTGSGRFFCAGADIGQTEGARRSGGPGDAGDGPPRPPLIDARSTVEPFLELYKTYWELETPVVAAVNGGVSGAGLPLCFGADLVVAARGATFRSVWAEGGMSAHAGDPYILPKVFPLQRLMQFAMLRERFDADTLLGWGVLNAVVEPDELDETVLGLARRLAEGPTLSLGQTKRLYRRSLETDQATAFAEEAAAVVMLSPTHDRKEGMKALVERREPMFDGW